MLALFDLDNTLIDRHGCLNAWARDFVRSRRLPWEAAAVVCTELQERAYPSDFVRLREMLGLRDAPADLWREYLEGFARSVRCAPGVLVSLEELRRAGWAIGIATNGAGDIQRAKLDAAGLTPLFDGICVSEDIRARKPAYSHFEAAAQMCGRRLSAGGWMVGDDPHTDIEGAGAAGLRTLWVANGQPWAHGPREPDIVAQDAAEAIDALRELAP